MEGNTVKRGHSDDDNDAGGRKKVKKLWHPYGSKKPSMLSSIEPGDAGIFATCPRNKENKCVKELQDLFQDYASRLYGEVKDDGATVESLDIQAGVSAEIEQMQRPEREPLFSIVRLEIPCVVFVKTRRPVSPVELVHKICEDALASGRCRTRFTLRLSPMSVMCQATEKGIDEAATLALAPFFHAEGSTSKKFAIRPSLRHNPPTVTRETVIKQIAHRVGVDHKVDLKNYDLLILVEVYKYACGIGVVTADYEKLRRFNLAEICAPSSKAANDP